MKKNQYKLILADMDGTLLNSQKQLSEGILDYLHKQSMQGILFGIASGRQYASLKNQFETIQNDLIFVAENGMYIVYQDQELFSFALTKEKVAEFIHIAHQIENANVVLCGKKQAYYEKKEVTFYNEALRYYAKLQYVENLNEVLSFDDDILKVAIWCKQGTEKNIYPHFSHIKDHLVSVSAFDWLDIMPKGFNKGTAVTFLQDYFHITKDETVAFGDYLNDYEMMQEATYSYAMKNAHPDLIQISNFVTEYSNDEDGVYRQLIQLLGE